MEHIEGHPYAFLDADNNVINIAVFDVHDQDLVVAIAHSQNAMNFVSCCEFGRAYIGGKFDGSKFIPTAPHHNWIWDGNEWVPPTPKPDDGLDYWWNQETTTWEVIPNVLPEELEQGN